MHRYVALCVSTVFLGTGCGGATRSSVAFSDAAASFARSTPTPSREVAPVSECAGPAECQRACEAGEAGEIPACTRWGDMIFGEQPARAEALWLDACRRRDGVACVRMMALAATKPRMADAYARHACAYGVTHACELLGSILLLRGHVEETAQRAKLMEDAADTFERGCGFEHWKSCVWAAQLYQEKELADRRSRQKYLLGRAFAVATAACEGTDYDACLFRGLVFDELDRLDDARESYARGCRVFIESAPTMPYADAVREPACRRASELAVVPPAESIVRPESSAGLLHASRVTVEARRISGSPVIYPPMAARVQMQRQGTSSISAVVRLCLSSSGLVESLRFIGASGFPIYDLQLLETMRRWRYSSFMIDGITSPVCTLITFVYTQS